SRKPPLAPPPDLRYNSPNGAPSPSPASAQEDCLSMSRWNLSWLLGISLVSLVGLAAVLNLPAAQGPLQNKHENLKLLVDVLEEVQSKYVKKLDDAKMRELVENMINGGLEQLDPHSSFINAEEYKQFQRQSRGKFGGVGIRIGHDRSGMLFVESPM